MNYPGYNPRISELIQQQGQNDANLRLQQGQNLGQLISTLGGIAAKLPMEVRNAQIEDRAKKEVNLAHTLAAKYRRADGTTDFGLVLNGLRAAGAHQAADEVEKQLVAQKASDAALAKENATTANLTNEAKNRDITTGVAVDKDKREATAFIDPHAEIEGVKAITQKFVDPNTGKVGDWKAVADAARAAGYTKSADEIMTRLNADQAAVNANAAAKRALFEKNKMDAATQLSTYRTPAEYTAKRNALAPEVRAFFPEQPPKNRNAILKIGTTPKEQLDISLDEQRIAKQGAADDAVLTLTPEALALTAHQYAMTGQLPPMGMGKAGAAVRTAIINEAAKVYAGLDLPTQIAAFKANQASLSKMQQQRDAVGSFEETALKNLDVFLESAKKISDTGSPLLNKPLRGIDERLLGSAEMSAFNTARRTVIPEFAKILNNPTLSGQLSDSARHEVEQVISGDATLAQIIAAARVLKTDVHNRKQSLDDTIADIQKRIATPPGGKKDEKPTLTAAELLKKYGGG